MVPPTPDPVLLPVPLHPSRHRRRGYNQSQLLAGELARRLPTIARTPAPGRLRRVRDTPSQVGLDRVQRRLNVAGAFRWEGSDLAGRPVLLVDDVATTGATLQACAEALRAGGAGRVTAVTVARVQV